MSPFVISLIAYLYVGVFKKAMENTEYEKVNA